MFKKLSKVLIFSLMLFLVMTLVGCADEEKPVITGTPEAIKHVVGEEVNLLEGVVATDNETEAKNLKMEVTALGGYNKDIAGNYTITITVTDEAGNTATIDRSVVVEKETTKPVITITGDALIVKLKDKADLLQGVTATDNVSKDVTLEVTNYGGFDSNKLGEYTITITATDEAGNVATMDRIVRVCDLSAPIFTTQIASTLSHIAGETIDLVVDLEGVDNVDGTDVTFEVSDMGTYNKDVAGEYTIKVVCKDKAGNASTPLDRKVVVNEKYARVEYTTFDNQVVRCPIVYNPQVLNGQTATNYNTGYDGSKAIVLSKSYLEWMLEYAPDRIGAHMGWCVIAVTDADNKIVYVRHWNSGEAYLEDGKVVSISSVDWCTGSVRAWIETLEDGTTVNLNNGKYAASEMGMQLANINKWIPANGNVVIFMNWASLGENAEGAPEAKTNTSDMPRAFGAQYIMNSDEDGDDVKDYALGRELKIADKELSTLAVFDPEKPFPVITIPSQKYILTNGTYRNDYQAYLYTNMYNNPSEYNPLAGVTANDGLGADITDKITYRILRYTTQKQAYGFDVAISIPLNDPLFAKYYPDKYVNYDNLVVTTEQVFNSDNGTYFVVEYTVEANGQKDVAYRLLQVNTQAPDYLELFDKGDTAYSVVMGVEQRLERNPDLDEFGAFGNCTKGIIYFGEEYKALEAKGGLDKGVVVVLDKFYNIKALRISNGKLFELTSAGKAVTEITWGTDNMFKDLVVEATDYVLVYPEGVINKALKAFYDVDFVDGEIENIAPANGNVRVKFAIKNVVEVNSIKFGNETKSSTLALIENSKAGLMTDGSGAGFRKVDDTVFMYNKADYLAFLENEDVKKSFTVTQKNLGIPWANNGVVVITDAEGKFVLARIACAAYCEVLANGTVVYPTAEAPLTWDTTVLNGEVVHGILANIEGLIPDGGKIWIYAITGNSSNPRNEAIKMFYNPNYVSGAIVDPAKVAEGTTADPNALFNAEVITTDYLASIKFESLFVSTEKEKPAKLARPVVTLSEANIISFKKVSPAREGGVVVYDLYVNGKLFKANIGVVDGDYVTCDLSTLTFEAGTYKLQVRALTDDSTLASTSVLSDAIEWECKKLAKVENVVLDKETKTISWDAVPGATKYLVKINDGEYTEQEGTSLVLTEETFLNGTIVKIIAAGSPTEFDSNEVSFSVVISVPYISFGNYVSPAVEYTSAKWLEKAVTDVGATSVEGMIVIKDAYALKDAGDETKVFSGGTLMIYDSEMNLKYFVDRWGHQYNQEKKWFLASGNTTDASGDWILNFFVKDIKEYLAEGDIIVLASQWAKGLQAGTYRNLVGYAYQGPKNAGLNDHRSQDITTYADPTTVKVAFGQTTGFVVLGNYVSPAVEYTSAKWLEKAVTDVGATSVEGMIVIKDAYALKDAGDETKVFSGGTLMIYDSEMNLKYFVDRWGHQYNQEKKWFLASGNTTDASGDWILNFFVKDIKEYLAECDIIVLASQWAKGLQAGTYRNLVGYAYQGPKNAGLNDHRSQDITTYADPTTVKAAIIKVK